MPFGYDWKCNHCDNTIRTSALWEFYRDSSGSLVKYGHPGTHSKRAAKAGIKGFYAEFYCPKCREVRIAPVIEFAKSYHGALDALCAAEYDPTVKKYDVVCEVCHTELIDYLDESNICPKCNIGHFEESARYMS
jgi:hypothetical protein